MGVDSHRPLQVCPVKFCTHVLQTLQCLLGGVSVTAIFSGLAPVVGERVYPLDKDGNYVLDENGEAVYKDIYYEEEEETPLKGDNSSVSGTGGADAPADTSETKQVTISLRGELSAEAQWGMNVLIQLLTATILVLLVYTAVWSVGDKDANLVAFGHREHDLLRGLKIGALATVPAAVAYIVYVTLCMFAPTKAEAYTSLYCWLNAPFMPLVNAANGVQLPVLEKALLALP